MIREKRVHFKLHNDKRRIIEANKNQIITEMSK